VFLPRSHVNVGPCHHGTTRPRVADGGDGLQIWKVVANMLDEKARTADKGWALQLWDWARANNMSP